jgi:TPR repeat protein
MTRFQVAYWWVFYDLAISPEVQEQNNQDNTAAEDDRIMRGMVSRAESGSVEDQLMLGKTYRDGYRVRRDAKLAQYWYQQAADTGSADGMFLLAKLLHGEGIGLEHAVKFAKRAASQNHADGQALYGDMMLSGQGCTQDLDVAERMLLLAADQKNGYAMISLATLQRARGNKVEAKQWLHDAAKRDISDAYVILGDQAMEDGDYVASVHWYSQVVDESLNAQFALAMIYMHGPTSHLDQRKAVQMFRDVAKAGKSKQVYKGRGGFVEDSRTLRVEALHELGQAYMNGDGVDDIDKSRACHWYEVAAEEGYADSQVEVAKCYIAGDRAI